MLAKSLAALLILSAAMAAPGGGGRDVSSKGHFKSDVAETPEVDWSYESGQLDGAPADGKDDMDIKLSPAGAPASPKGSAPELPMDASALSGSVPDSASSGSSPAVSAGAPKDGKDGKDGKDTKTAAPLDHKGDSDKESSYNGPGSYDHTGGEWDMDTKGGKDCDKCKGGDKTPEGGKKPHGGMGGDKPPPCPDCPKPSPSTSCATSSTPAPPPPPPSTPACPFPSNPCAAPKTPPTEKAKTPEGETKPPVQVGSPAPTAPPSKPEAPKTPAGAKPPKAAPSTPVTQHGAASGLSVGPLSQLAVVGVVSYAVITLIL